MQNQGKFSMILFKMMKNWRFDMILLFLKWFCFIENLIEWQNSQKAYKKQTLGYAWSYNTQNYLNEYYPDYNPGLWLTACSIFGGSFGVFAGGWLSDRLVQKFGLHSRLWLLSVTTVS